MLGPSTDEYDELEDEIAVIEEITFIANESFLEEHGSAFIMTFTDGRLEVQPAK